MDPLAIVFWTLLPLSGASAGQEPAATRPPRPIVVAVGTHTLAFPWSQPLLSAGVNPGLMIGTELAHITKQHFRLYQPVSLGFFQHEFIQSALFANTDVGISYLTGLGLHVDALIGAGYLHAFSRRPLFELKDGEYQTAADRGRPAAMLSVATALGYQFRKDGRPTFNPFVQYRWFVQVPFAQEFPAMTHLLLSIGTRIHFRGRAS